MPIGAPGLADLVYARSDKIAASIAIDSWMPATLASYQGAVVSSAPAIWVAFDASQVREGRYILIT